MCTVHAHTASYTATRMAEVVAFPRRLNHELVPVFSFLVGYPADTKSRLFASEKRAGKDGAAVGGGEFSFLICCWIFREKGA